MKSRETSETHEHVVVQLVDSKGVSVRYDEKSKKLSRGRSFVQLTPTESRLFQTFISHPDKVLSFAVLNYTLYPDDSIPQNQSDLNTISNDIRPYICRLRGKLSQVGLSSRLETVRGSGFVFTSPMPPSR